MPQWACTMDSAGVCCLIHSSGFRSSGLAGTSAASGKQLAAGARVSVQHQAALGALTQEQLQLQNWLNRLEADNRANPALPVCEARMNSGFSSGENLSRLFEIGYQVNTKASGGSTTVALRETLPSDAV